MKKFAIKYLKDKRKENLIILDLGSQDINGSYKELFSSPAWKYIGIDTSEGKNVDIVISDPYSWNNIHSEYADVIFLVRHSNI